MFPNCCGSLIRMEVQRSEHKRKSPHQRGNADRGGGGNDGLQGVYSYV